MKNIKKFLLLVCSLSMFTTNVYASEAESKNYKGDIYATLVSDLGETIVLEGKKVKDDRTSTYSLNNGTRNIGYEFAVYSVNGTLTESNQGQDGSYSATAYLEIIVDYHTDYSINETVYLLRSLNGHWGTIDSTIQVTSASLEYMCTDVRDNTQVRTISVNNNFNVNTGFSIYCTDDFASIGGKLTLNLLMGSSRRWSFTLHCNIIDTYV